MRKLLLSSIFLLSISFAKAQTAVDSVKATINQLFTGMKTSNSQLISDAFADSAVMQSIARTRDGKTIIRNESYKDFASSISKYPAGELDERITFDIVKVDANLAIAWTPYKFYLKGNFSHCGVNSFQLVRVNGIWKIQYLIDTRRKDGCVE
jgi:hypothetical protein